MYLHKEVGVIFRLGYMISPCTHTLTCSSAQTNTQGNQQQLVNTTHQNTNDTVVLLLGKSTSIHRGRIPRNEAR